MIVFPNAKINLGLAVTERRDDGFHNIESVFYPLAWRDALEVIEQSNGKPTTFQISGRSTRHMEEQNIVLKALELLKSKHHIPNVQIHLHKVIPTGAGLGGGSADAAFFIDLMNKKFSLNIPQEKISEYALSLGSDCPFFIKNTPAFAKGRGELLEEINIDLNSYKILVVNPGIHSSTKEAFKGIRPQHPKLSIKECVSTIPIEEWKNNLFNDFEPGIFSLYPRVAELKEMMYTEGAIYASMSGSGSSVYGIYKSLPQIALKKGESSFSCNM